MFIIYFPCCETILTLLVVDFQFDLAENDIILHCDSYSISCSGKRMLHPIKPNGLLKLYTLK